MVLSCDLAPSRAVCTEDESRDTIAAAPESDKANTRASDLKSLFLGFFHAEPLSCRTLTPKQQLGSRCGRKGASISDISNGRRARLREIGATENEKRCDGTAKACSKRSPGNKTASLLIRDPAAILATIGISRAAGSPVTYFGVTAASSITMPPTCYRPWWLVSAPSAGGCKRQCQ